MAGFDCKQPQLANPIDNPRNKLTVYWVSPVSRISAGSESPARWLTITGLSGHHHWNTHFRGLMKNTAQLTTLFGLSNLWMARKQLMGMGELRA